MIKQGLNTSLGQSLTLTPQLQQAIRLLQLSSIELNQEIQENLDSNPLLEIADAQGEPEASQEAEDSFSDDATAAEHLAETIPDDLSIDADWKEIYSDYEKTSPTSSDATSTTTILENTNSQTESLQEHLLWQIRLSHLSPVDQIIAKAIIESVDDKGYLTSSSESIYQLLNPSLLIEEDEVESMLTYVQHLDPIGCGARSLVECLAIQLQVEFADQPLAVKAARLLLEDPTLIGPKQHAVFRKKLKITAKQFSQLIGLLKTLNPHPGNSFNQTTSEYITPDVFVRKNDQGQWTISLNQGATPHLQLNDFYTNLLLEKGSSEDKTYLKKQLQQANWLIKSLEGRNQTILKVARAIIGQQQAFLQYGDTAMKPLILKDIAEQLEMHESSISRATNSKYIHTPQGIYELKHFFSSHVSTDTGGSCSSTAIQAMIKQLIDKEDLKKPLSDNKLTTLLKEQGIQVARRTVAKYRESMNIPASSKRKIIA